MTDYVKMAKQALERPSDFGWFGDDEMFITWGLTGPVNVINSDDVLDESNFEVFKKLAAEKFGDASTGDMGPHFDVVGIKHWAVGSMDQITTQVVKTDCAHPYLLSTVMDQYRYGNTDWLEEDDLTDEFKFVCDILIGLRDDYPVLDDDDYSERRYNAAYDAFVNYGLPFEVDHNKVDDIIEVLHDEFNVYIDEDVPISDDDIYLAAYLAKAEDREFAGEEWEAWEFLNPSYPIQRYHDEWEKAGQIKLEMNNENS